MNGVGFSRSGNPAPFMYETIKLFIKYKEMDDAGAI